MKVKKTKIEKTKKAKEKSKESLEVISAKVEEFGEVEVEFGRKDFKKVMSTNVGFGFQDMKEKHRKTIKGLLGKGYDVDFKPTSPNVVGLKMTVTKDND